MIELKVDFFRFLINLFLESITQSIFKDNSIVILIIKSNCSKSTLTFIFGTTGLEYFTGLGRLLCILF